MMGKQFKLLSTGGVVGYGFPDESLEKAMALKPDFLACDAGSTDAGPYHLGEGVPFVSHAAFKHDLECLMLAALKAGIPLIVGSCTGGGGDDSLQFAVDICKEIANEHKLSFKLGVVHSELDKPYLKKKLAEGKITSLGYLPELTEADIDEAVHTVGMQGPEVLVEALNRGADVVLAGRTTDTSIFSSVPVSRGFNPGLCWHAGKVLECGAASTKEFKIADVSFITIDAEEDCFTVEPMNPNLHHTPLSVAAHSLYENADPSHFYEPGGMLDITETTYEALSDRKVKVKGSKWIPNSDYTIKLESAKFVGHRTIAIMATHDPILISQIHEYEQIVKDQIKEQVQILYGDTVTEDDYFFTYKKYGIDAVMGQCEKNTQVPFEVGIVADVVAKTEELSRAICAMARTYSIHHDFPNRKCTAGNMAIAFSPSDIYVGKVYDFHMEHIVHVDDPLEMARFEQITFELGEEKK